ncbi:MAG: exodeoxyribonuclease VII large subunit [Muribaculaceae bacterium]|nr:exodeoxyribonuclease VII large subunit [Bacteroidales bacterium]MDY4810797.1 exodeoxyribonuclease VII large subunit [Muribaculaceae bacterium]
MPDQSISLLELTRRIAYLVQAPETQNVWVTAELQDVNARGGHCYMELLQKDEAGRQVARIRGCCWANIYGPLARRFYQATGQQFASGLKVMLKVSASMHPVFGLSLVVLEVNPEYTLGDLVRRRMEIINRLQKEGVLEMNRQLQWPKVVQRIAVISAKGAAGYGDFLNQLYHNPMRLRFHTELFQATMQGTSAPASIIDALSRIADRQEEFDGVVIIRGGGATSDLQAYEDYDLAVAVAQFPLPIAIGIGHERDITVLDWVANTRLKTPTAVAEWLISRNENVLNALGVAGNKILQLVNDRLAGNKQQLAQAEALLPVAARGTLDRRNQRLRQAIASLAGLPAAKIQPALARLDAFPQRIADAIAARITFARGQINAQEHILKVLSPAATLARGYSITRIDGHAVSSVQAVPPGSILEITLSDGTISATSRK